MFRLGIGAKAPDQFTPVEGTGHANARHDGIDRSRRREGIGRVIDFDARNC
jgi:hypothetical protein